MLCAEAICEAVTRANMRFVPTKIGHWILIKPALVGPHLGWGTIAVPGDEPSFVVVPGELDERGSQFFDGIEGPHPQQVLLQGSDESLCDAIALGFSHEGEGEASIPRHSIS